MTDALVIGSGPNGLAAAVRARSRYSTAASPSGSGCAEQASGCTHSRPKRASGIRANTGDAAAAG